MVHWEQLCPGGFRFVWEDSLFRPSTDSFLLSSLPRLRPASGSVTLAAAPGFWRCCCFSGSVRFRSPVWIFNRRPSLWRSRPPRKTA